MFPVLAHFGGKPLTSAVVFSLAGIWAAYFTFRWSAGRLGLSLSRINFIMIGSIVAWFGGARALQLLTVGGTGFTSEPKSYFSGLVLYGGVVATLAFGVFTGALFLKRKVLVHALGDSGTLALAMAMGFGRIGCFLYGCCYGSPSGSWPGFTLNHADWDTEYRAFPAHLDGIRLHPAPLYESIGWFMIAGGVFWMLWRERSKPGTFPPGVPTGIAWIAYATLRFGLEFIRGDNRGPAVLGLEPSQWIALVFVPVCLWRIYRDRRNPSLQSV